MWLFTELKRRNVFRVAAAYVVASWLLIQVAETIFPLFGFAEGPARAVVIILAIGFPLLLIFSWLYELTPEGLRLEKEVDRSSLVLHHTGKKLDRAIIIVLALSLSYFAFDKFILDPTRDAVIKETAVQRGRSEALVESYGENSIAVLPFVNMTDDASNEYFSDGISEELLNLLSKIPGLRVISRSSSFTFKGKDIDIPTIAEQLDVAYVLEGSVRRAGYTVRITAQLIEARSDTHLWSETYDRELNDIFAVQDEISTAIVAELREELAPVIDTSPRTYSTANTEAHEAYLRGRYLVTQRTQESVDAAIREFEKAITLDPDYALAHAELAMAVMLGYFDQAWEEAEALAALHAARAMALDPALAESQAAAGWVAWYPAGILEVGHLEEALTHYENAVQINPNYSDAYTWMANILEFRLGRYKESFEMREMALRLNPLSIPANWTYILGLLARNRFAEADRQLEKLDSVVPASYAWMRDSRVLRGVESAYIALAMLDQMQIDPRSIGDPKILAKQFALMGLAEEALALSEQGHARTMRILGKSADFVTEALAMLDENPGPRNSYVVGHVLASAGDYAGARALLEDAWQQYGRRVTAVFPADAAAALTVIRRSDGDEDNVDELLAAIRDDVRRQRDAGINEYCRPDRCAVYDDGLVAYLSGDYAQGLTLIGKAVEDGYFVLPNDAYLQALYDDPDFAPILAVQLDRQKLERDKFLAIVCSDNPYAAVWKPEDITCGRFMAESGN